MKVRELTSLISSCDVKRIFSAVRGHVTPDDGPGKDTGLPVFGECTISPYPIYFGVETSGDGYRVTLGQKVSGAVKDTLPGGAKRLSKWYCLSSDLRGYKTIAADKVPTLCRKVGYLGGYVVMVDTMLPGGGNEIQDDAVYALLADMVLRFDTKAVVRDEAIKAGCRYINGPASEASDMPHIALVPRSDIGVEYDFRLNQWRRIENLGDVSSLNNKTQHRDFVAICQRGKVPMTGEEIAKLVLSTQDAINQLGQTYLDHMDELLAPTRFKVLHPMDTKGYFLRMSASTIATASTKAIYAPAISHFPVWLHDTLLDKYYEINLGLAPVDVAYLPENREVAGKLGSNCEVIYDKDAQDMYDTQQLAYLACLIMKSKYPNKEAEGVLAMYGCMEHLNSVFAPLLIGNGVDCLPEIKGTRIENLNPDPSVVVGYDAIIGLSTSCAKALSYSASSDAVTQVPEAMSDRERVLTGECTYATTKSFVLGRALARFSEAKPFETWEAGLLARMTLELEEVPPAYADFFSKAPHVKDPIRVAKAGWAVLEVEGTYYTLTPDYDWAEVVNFKLPETYMAMGQFFCGALYCQPQDIQVSSDMLTKLMVSTAQYFVNFSDAPTVFKYLYNMDPEGSRWRVTGVDQSTNCVMFGNEDGTFAFDPATSLWSYSNIRLDIFTQLGPVKCFVPDELLGNLTVELLNNACRSFGLCLSGLQDKDSKPVPAMLMRQRAVAHTTENADWTITVGNQAYANVDGDWAVYTGPGYPESPSTQVDAEVFFGLLLNYICYFVRFQEKDERQYALISKALGGALEAVAGEAPEYELEGYMWIDRNEPMAFGSTPWKTKNPGFLPIKVNASSNLMGISYHLDSSIGVVTVADFAACLLCLNSVNRLFDGKTGYPTEDITAAYKSFVDHQAALVDSFEEGLSKEAPATPLVTVGKYTWDGDEWTETGITLSHRAGDLWGNVVTYSSAFANSPIPTNLVVTALFQITTLLWEPDKAWFPILESIRKR